MRDPFASKGKSQLYREAQIGFCVVALTAGLFAYVTFNRLAGHHPIPEHVQNAEPSRQVNLIDVGPSDIATILDVRPLNALNDFPRVEARPKIALPSHQREPLRSEPTSTLAVRKRTLTPFKPVPVLPIPKLTIPVSSQWPGAIPEAAKGSVKRFVFSPRETESPRKDRRPNQYDIAVDATRTRLSSAQSAAFVDDIPERPKSTAVQPAPPRTEITRIEDTRPNPTETKFDPAISNMDANSLATPLPDDDTEDKRLDNSERGSVSVFANSPVVDVMDKINSTDTPYVTENGDSFWTISQSFYGDGRFFVALYKYNQAAVTGYDDLPLETKLRIPDRSTLISLWPKDCPAIEGNRPVTTRPVVQDSDSRVYFTREGDTLFGIARERLGQASRFVEIYQLNRSHLIAELDHLAPLSSGIRLELPID